MTSHHREHNRAPTARLFQDNLVFEYQLVGMLKNAAARVAVNYRLLSFAGKDRSLPFLDFDVIWGAMPSIAVKSQCTQLLEDNRLALANLIGPHSLTNLLADGMEYCLPPGTMIELVGKASMLKTGTTERVRRLLRVLLEATQSSDPIGIILRTFRSTEIAEILQEELQKLRQSLGDLWRIEEIVAGAIPFENFVDPSGIDENEVFRDALDQLSRKRPDLDVNNSNDALNIALVAHVLRRPRRGSAEHAVPIFISQTKDVLGLDSLVDKALGGGDKQRYLVLNTFQYLTVSQRLGVHCEGKCEPIAAHSRLLEKQLGNLASSYEKLLNALGNDEIAYDDMGSEQWCSLLLQRKQFEEAWGWLLERPRQACIQDRIAFVNAMDLWADTASPSEEDGPSRMREAIQRAVRILREELAGQLEVDGAVDLGRAVNLVDAGTQSVLQSIFAFSYVHIFEDPGSLLMETEGGNPFVRGLLRDEAELGRGIRVFVHSRIMQSKGVIVSVDIRRVANGAIEITFAWPHAAPALDFFRAAMGAIRSLARAAVFDQTLTMKTYYEAGGDVEEVIGCDSTASARLVARRNGCDAGCFEIFGNALSLFADFGPIEGVEMQANLSFLGVTPTASVLDAVAGLVAASNKYRGMWAGEQLYHAVFSYILEELDGGQSGR